MYKIPYDDLVQLIHINIDFLRKLDYTKVVDDKLKKDLYFLTCEDNKKLNFIYKGDNLMEEIIKEAKEIAGIEKMHLYLTDEEICRLDFEDGYKKGKEETSKEEKKQVIANMLKENLPLELISKCVNLPKEKVEEIIRELEKKN